jgi:hypothetical protein
MRYRENQVFKLKCNMHCRENQAFRLKCNTHCRENQAFRLKCNTHCRENQAFRLKYNIHCRENQAFRLKCNTHCRKIFLSKLGLWCRTCTVVWLCGRPAGDWRNRLWAFCTVHIISLWCTNASQALLLLHKFFFVLLANHRVCTIFFLCYDIELESRKAKCFARER